MTGFERRWASALLSSFAPEGGPGLHPRAGEVDYLATLRTMRAQATPLAAFGLRFAVWLLALSPLWACGRLCTAARLPVERRAALLARMLRHRSFLVREMTLLLKFVAAMALLGTQSVRERSGYDAVGAPSKTESGVRRRLPLAAAALVPEEAAPPPDDEVAK